MVDLQVEPQVEIPQLRSAGRARGGGRATAWPRATWPRLLETAYKGRVVSTVLDEERYFDLVVWYDEAARSDPRLIAQTILDTPSGRKVALGQVAEVLQTTGPEHDQPRGRRSGGSSSRATSPGATSAASSPTSRRLGPRRGEAADLPGGYCVEYGGQFEAQQQATQRLLLLGGAGGRRRVPAPVQVPWSPGGRRSQVLLVNIPLAAIGSVVALLLISIGRCREACSRRAWWRWPRVWAGRRSCRWRTGSASSR